MDPKTQVFVLVEDSKDGPKGILVDGDHQGFELSVAKDQDGFVSANPGLSSKVGDIKIQTASEVIAANGGNQFQGHTIDMRNADPGSSISFQTKPNGGYQTAGDGAIKVQEGIVNTTRAAATAAVDFSPDTPKPVAPQP